MKRAAPSEEKTMTPARERYLEIAHLFQPPAPPPSGTTKGVKRMKPTPVPLPTFEQAANFWRSICQELQEQVERVEKLCEGVPDQHRTVFVDDVIEALHGDKASPLNPTPPQETL